jgi:PleD family two-component response regulator
MDSNAVIASLEEASVKMRRKEGESSRESWQGVRISQEAARRNCVPQVLREADFSSLSDTDDDASTCSFLQPFLACSGSAVAVGSLRLATPSLSDSILVIDDDADNRDLVIASLQAKGFTAHAAPDGATALVLADTLRPRVILMDLTMLSHGGLEMMRIAPAVTSLSRNRLT